MQVETVARPGPDWDEFVEARGEAGLGHASVWAQILEASYGLATYHLIARDVDGRIAGILGLSRVRTWRGRSELVSLPFLDSAGMLARDAAAESALLHKALELARELGTSALELRRENRRESGETSEPAGPRVDLVLPLEENP